jgi:hypothetical protein
VGIRGRSRKETAVAVTGTCADVFFLTLPEEIDFDSEQGVARDELVEEFNARFQPLPEDALVDADVDDNVF